MDRNRLKLVDIINTNKKFSDVRFGQFTSEGECMAINQKYVACVWDGVGSTISIFNKFNPCRIPADNHLVYASREKPTDVLWNPFKKNQLCVADESGVIRFFQIPEQENFKSIEKETLKYDKQNRRIVKVKFHPCSKEIIGSCGYGKDIHIWNAENANTIFKINIPEIPYCLDWNYNGSFSKFTNVFVYNI